MDEIKMCRAYQIEIEATDDEAENLRRFDAEWQKIRQDCFGDVLKEKECES